MKKILLIFCMMGILLTGCSKNHGSFEQGTIDFESFYMGINKQIDEEQWNMPLLNDKALSDKEVESLYQIDMTKIESCIVKQSILPSQIGEVAFFKVKKEHMNVVEDGINNRLQGIQASWGTYLTDAKASIDGALQGMIGEYYYFVIGEDAKKVVNYMESEAK